MGGRREGRRCGAVLKAFDELCCCGCYIGVELTVCLKKSTLPMMLNLAMTQISIMSYSHSQDNQEELDPQDFIDRPMIILSSNSEPQLPDPEPIQHTPSITDAHQLMLIERKRESEQQKLKKLNSIKSIWNQQEERERRELQDIRKNPPKKANLQAIKAKEAELHNIFIGHRYLPISVLEAARERLEDFKSHPRCQFQKVANASEQQISMRQKNRENLTKNVILACEEVRLLEDKTKKQKKLFENSLDLLAYSYRVAAEIQANFFKKLYNKMANKIGEAYHQQLKLIDKQFRDKNNLAFRRRIINNQFDLHELANASEDSLTCEKTKREEEEKRKQLIRENQKIAPEAPIDLEDDIIEVPAIESIRSFESIRSRSDIQEQRPQDLEKEQQFRKNKKICKETHHALSKHLKEMKWRMDRLRANPSLRLPADLTFPFL